MADRVQHHEIVDRTVVAHRVDADARLLQLARIGVAFVTQRIELERQTETSVLMPNSAKCLTCLVGAPGLEPGTR